MKKTGIELIAQERQEQLEKHGFAIESDKQYENGELLCAAFYAVTCDPQYSQVGWELFEEKIEEKYHEIDRLSIAGALIAAEIDRLNALKEGK